MQNIMDFKRRGYLTDQQVFHAHKFSVSPNSYNLAPTFHRVLYDVIIKEGALENAKAGLLVPQKLSLA